MVLLSKPEYHSHPASAGWTTKSNLPRNRFNGFLDVSETVQTENEAEKPLAATQLKQGVTEKTNNRVG